MANGLWTSFITVTAVALFWLSPAPGAEAVTDQMLKIACSDMTPRHPGFKPENVNHVTCPYRLVVDKIPVVPGELVNLTLTSITDTPAAFKGFMVQARDADDNVLGTFLPVCENHGGNKSHHMISCTNGIEPYVSIIIIIIITLVLILRSIIVFFLINKYIQKIINYVKTPLDRYIIST